MFFCPKADEQPFGPSVALRKFPTYELRISIYTFFYSGKLHHMITEKFRRDFYFARLTNRDIAFVAHLASHCIDAIEKTGRGADLWRWVWHEVFREMSRRGNSAEGNVQEPEPLRLPDWTGSTLGCAMLDAQQFSYCNLAPAVADFADWLSNILTIKTIDCLVDFENKLSLQSETNA